MEDVSHVQEDLGPPEPQRERPNWHPTLGGIAVVGGLVGGTLLALVTCFPQRTMGATRSARLRWEERQRNIERAIRDQTAPEVQGHDRQATP